MGKHEVDMSETMLGVFSFSNGKLQTLHLADSSLENVKQYKSF